MLPVPADSAGRLAAVLDSSLASIAGEPNALVPAAGAQCGRGARRRARRGRTSRQRAGHARYLASRLAEARRHPHGVPVDDGGGARELHHRSHARRARTRRATACSTPTGDRVVNQLNGWDDGMRPESWQRVPTLFEQARERGLRDASRSAPHAMRTRASRMPCCAARSTARARPSPTGSPRRSEWWRRPSRRCVYLYVPELDQAAHAHGWQSDRWLGHLEELDAEIARLRRSDAAWLGPARHRRSRRHRRSGAPPPLHRRATRPLDGVRHVGGEPRCLSLYFEPGLDEAGRAELVDRLAGGRGRARVGADARRGDRGTDSTARSTAEVRPRIGDVIVAARAGVAYYDRREPNRQAESMIGQHGSLSDDETRVPLIRAGAYARR